MKESRKSWGGVLRGFSRLSALAFCLLIAGLLPLGCDGPSGASGYDPETRFSLRTDPLVLKVPEQRPDRIPAAGHGDEALRVFPELKGTILLPESVEGAERAKILAALEQEFGTPASPRLADAESIDGLDVSPLALAEGSKLYRRMCMQCHGMAGDGRGPNGAWVHPQPRDFRRGIFKLAIGDSAPEVADLLKLLKKGVPGTAMPPFDLNSEEELRGALAAMIHLSIRGEVEFQLLKGVAEGDIEDVPAEVTRRSKQALARWRAARTARPTISADESTRPDFPDSVRRGHELFRGSAGCATCHRDYGATETFQYDIWGGVARVTDLTRGEFKWGADTATLELRVRHGIPAVAMPANDLLSAEQIRDLRNFLTVVGAPPRLPTDLKSIIHPKR